MNAPYPFGLGDFRLLYSECSSDASPILLGTRTQDYRDSMHLFAPSDVVKQQLEIDIIRSRGIDDRVHPELLELRAAVSSITFFECVAAEDDGRWGTPKVIEHDNWQRIFWTFVRLFESGVGFLARWEDRFSDMKELWEKEPRYSVDQLRVTALSEDCGKCYSTATGQILLEYVDKI